MENLVQSLVTLPVKLQLALAGAVLYAVRLALGGRVPDQYLSEIAAAISTALITIVGVLLGAIPPEFEAVANAILALLVSLLGTVTVVRGYFLVRENMLARGFRS